MDKEKIGHRGLLTGAFDPIHSDHIVAIQRAAQLCNELVVAVSTDSVIWEYKHHITSLPLEVRLPIVAGIKGVHEAIPQNDLYDKLNMCLENNIDVLFSCEEYQREYYKNPEDMTDNQIAGVERWEKFENDLTDYGITVHYLPRGQGSSTEIKNQMAQRLNLQKPQGIMLYSEGEECCEDVFSL